MFPFWEVAVAPVLVAAGARRLVEIGALRGENTRQIIDLLGPDTELHVIDPLPDFDPAEHEREFGGQYVFHRDLSLNVLGSLPPMDAALIDGDHNWYTVYNECRLLAEVSRANGVELPVMLLHDVGWPYGRRDLYYDPTNIPDEFRRDWKRSGMEPGKTRLVPFGAGLNPTLANAKVMGGKRNGVMTGLEDFVAEHDKPMRVVVLPIYFGLAIAVEEERLARQPELAAELDRLESPAGKDQLLELSEDIRIQGLIFQHKIFYDRERAVHRLARRYLGQVKEGPVGQAAGVAALDHLDACLDTVREEYVLGHVAAVGVRRPAEAAYLKAYMEGYELIFRHVFVLDAAEPLAGVAAELERLDLTDDRTHPVDLGAADVDPSSLPDQLALLHVGAAAGPVPDALLDTLYDRLAHGAFVVVGDDVTPAERAAVDALRSRHGLAALAAGHTSWRKEIDGASGAPAEAHA